MRIRTYEGLIASIKWCQKRLETNLIIQAETFTKRWLRFFNVSNVNPLVNLTILLHILVDQDILCGQELRWLGHFLDLHLFTRTQAVHCVLHKDGEGTNLSSSFISNNSCSLKKTLYHLLFENYLAYTEKEGVLKNHWRVVTQLTASKSIRTPLNCCEFPHKHALATSEWHKLYHQKRDGISK